MLPYVAFPKSIPVSAAWDPLRFHQPPPPTSRPALCPREPAPLLCESKGWLWRASAQSSLRADHPEERPLIRSPQTAQSLRSMSPLHLTGEDTEAEVKSCAQAGLCIPICLSPEPRMDPPLHDASDKGRVVGGELGWYRAPSCRTSRRNGELGEQQHLAPLRC